MLYSTQENVSSMTEHDHGTVCRRRYDSRWAYPQSSQNINRSQHYSQLEMTGPRSDISSVYAYRHRPLHLHRMSFYIISRRCSFSERFCYLQALGQGVSFYLETTLVASTLPCIYLIAILWPQRLQIKNPCFQNLLPSVETRPYQFLLTFWTIFIIMYFIVSLHFWHIQYFIFGIW